MHDEKVVFNIFFFLVYFKESLRTFVVILNFQALFI